MISQSKIKLINSLSKKKFRDLNQLYIAEGEKLVLDLIQSSVEIKWLIAQSSWLSNHTIPSELEIIETSDQYLKKISQLKTPPPVIAICKFPSKKLEDISMRKKLTIALDELQDPGNLGTIIRLADWFGVENIICSNNTVDAYNPKVVQATMGAIARVNIFYTDLQSFLSQQTQQGTPIYGTFLDGENIYNQKLSTDGIIVMGNEGKGISSSIEKLISNKLLIPSFSQNIEVSESLNVSTATAITLSEFRRNI
ncbi:RNA methyltransferase [Labilibacter sediminis]|nr:RNA methyltransferase [Labilibacter sediminis]